MSGRTLVQYYFYKNCSSSASSSVQLEVVLTGTVGGKSRVPLSNITFTGGVMNRPCVDIKSPAAQLYNLRNTPDPLDKGNYVRLGLRGITKETLAYVPLLAALLLRTSTGTVLHSTDMHTAALRCCAACH
jgi:hypothetical protein